MKKRDRFIEKPLPPPEPEASGDFVKIVVSACFHNKVLKFPWPTPEQDLVTPEGYEEFAKRIADEIEFEILKEINRV